MLSSEEEIGKSELSIKTWALPVSKRYPGHGLRNRDPNSTRLLLLVEYTWSYMSLSPSI